MVEKYFNLLSIIPAIFWFIVIVSVGYAVRSRNSDKPHYRYFIPNLLAKIIFSLLFASVYIFIYEGGDTVAYYDGAVVLNNLFFKDFDTYWFAMTNSFDNSHYSLYYDLSTGYPPGWIYREPEGFFVAKLMSFFSFFTLKSYLAMTIIMAFVSSLASWKLFELARSYKLNNEKLLAFGILFLPSVNFWCSGVSKDSVVFIASLILIYNTFLIISAEKNATFKNYVYAIISGFIIYKIRSFILAAILLPLVFSVSSRIVKAMGGTDFIVASIRTLVLMIGLAIGGQTLLTTGEEDFINQNSIIAEAAVIQKDFSENQTYGDKKYDIGLNEFSPAGLLRATPFAILAGLYRPYVWEIRSPTLVLNGLESVLFLYFTFILFKSKFLEKWRKIRAHEFLIFCLIFTLVIAFMTGLTSGLYGVLVRLRSILLPFLFILLTVKFDRIETKKKANAKI